MVSISVHLYVYSDSVLCWVERNFAHLVISYLYPYITGSISLADHTSVFRDRYAIFDLFRSRT